MKPVAKFDIGSMLLLFIPNASKPFLMGEPITFAGATNGFHPDVPPESISIAASGAIFGFQNERRLYSDPVYNVGGVDYAVTYEIVGSSGHESNVIGNYVICWENGRYGDRDFQDAVFEISGVTPVSSMSADFNGDLLVGAADLSAWGSGFGHRTNAQVQQGDANRDYNVDGIDFLIWQRSYSQPASSLTVPEPTAYWLIAFSALVGIRRRAI